MRDDLLGYLLNTLDAARRKNVAQALAESSELRRELESLREQLDRFEPDSSAEEFEPPAGLLDQTCDLVEGCQELAIRREQMQASRELAGHSRGWTMIDTVVTTGIFVAISMLFFPAIANSRFRSHITSCQYNLQQLGTSLCNFSDIHDGLFPEIPTSGRRATAGIYAPILIEDQYIVDTRILICPGSEEAGQATDWRVPTLGELDRAGRQKLNQLRRTMGGSYGYTLGYFVDGHYYPPRNEGRSSFALMSDAPSLHLVGRRSSNHCGRGQNVLYEDCHIEFVVDERRDSQRDALFLNRFGYVEAGADKNDSVIGGSDAPPLIRLRFNRESS